jgi:hypothetical protein
VAGGCRLLFSLLRRCFPSLCARGRGSSLFSCGYRVPFSSFSSFCRRHSLQKIFFSNDKTQSQSQQTINSAIGIVKINAQGLNINIHSFAAITMHIGMRKSHGSIFCFIKTRPVAVGGPNIIGTLRAAVVNQHIIIGRTTAEQGSVRKKKIQLSRNLSGNEIKTELGQNHVKSQCYNGLRTTTSVERVLSSVYCHGYGKMIA